MVNFFNSRVVSRRICGDFGGFQLFPLLFSTRLNCQLLKEYLGMRAHEVHPFVSIQIPIFRMLRNIRDWGTHIRVASLPIWSIQGKARHCYKLLYVSLNTKWAIYFSTVIWSNQARNWRNQEREWKSLLIENQLPQVVEDQVVEGERVASASLDGRGFSQG